MKKLIALLTAISMISATVAFAACDSGNTADSSSASSSVSTLAESTDSIDSTSESTSIDSTDSTSISTSEESTESTDSSGDEGSGQIVYTVTESEWSEALSYKNFLNCTVTLYETDGTWGGAYNGYTNLTDTDGIITGKMFWNWNQFVTIDGVDTTYCVTDGYEYQTDSCYALYESYSNTYVENYHSSTETGTDNYFESTTEGFYARMQEVANSDVPLFLFLIERAASMYFDYSNFVYDETKNEYIYTVEDNSVEVIFENGYLTYVKLILGEEGGYMEWKYSDYGTTDADTYFTDAIMTEIDSIIAGN